MKNWPARSFRTAALCAMSVVLGSWTVACSPPPNPPPAPTNIDTIDVGGQTITVTGPTGTTVAAASADLGALPATPPNLEFPVGALDLQVAGVVPGSVVTITVSLEQGVDSAFKLLGGVWDPFAFDGTTGLTVAPDGLTITVLVQDGGAGDADGVADGTVIDPLLPADPPWMAPGCYSAGAGVGDIDFQGPPDAYHNALYIGTVAGDCVGPVLNSLTIVQAADSLEAYTTCVAANPAYIGVSNLATGFSPPYAGVPADAWVCAPPSV